MSHRLDDDEQIGNNHSEHSEWLLNISGGKPECELQIAPLSSMQQSCQGPAKGHRTSRNCVAVDGGAFLSDNCITTMVLKRQCHTIHVYMVSKLLKRLKCEEERKASEF